MSHVAVTLAEPPDLDTQSIPDTDIWPEFNLHGDTYYRFWSRLSSDFPEYQFVMCDAETGQVVADAHRAGLVESERRGMNVYHRPRRESLIALCVVLDPNCCR